MPAGSKNAYLCPDCKGWTITVHVDAGVTPMFLACRVKGEPTDPENDCRGRSVSQGYPEEPWPETDLEGRSIPTEPSWEWFRPTGVAYHRLSLEMRDHVDRGGLQLRRIAA